MVLTQSGAVGAVNALLKRGQSLLSTVAELGQADDEEGEENKEPNTPPPIGAGADGAVSTGAALPAGAEASPSSPSGDSSAAAGSAAAVDGGLLPQSQEEWEQHNLKIMKDMSIIKKVRSLSFQRV